MTCIRCANLSIDPYIMGCIIHTHTHTHTFMMNLNKIRIPLDGIKIKKRKIKKSFRPYLLESPKNWSKILQNLLLFYKTSSFFIILQKLKKITTQSDYLNIMVLMEWKRWTCSCRMVIEEPNQFRFNLQRISIDFLFPFFCMICRIGVIVLHTLDLDVIENQIRVKLLEMGFMEVERFEENWFV